MTKDKFIYCRNCGERIRTLADIGKQDNWSWWCSKCVKKGPVNPS